MIAKNVAYRTGFALLSVADGTENVTATPTCMVALDNGDFADCTNAAVRKIVTSGSVDTGSFHLDLAQAEMNADLVVVRVTATGCLPVVIILAPEAVWTATKAGYISGDAYARLGAPAGASVSADIALRPTNPLLTNDARLPADAEAGAVGGLPILDANTRIPSQVKAVDPNAITAAAIADAAIDNATFAADVGSTAYATNILALSANKALANTVTPLLPTALTANGNMKCSLMEILATALTETAGYIAAGFKKFFNVAAPLTTVASTNQTGDVFVKLPANIEHLAIADTTGTVTAGNMISLAEIAANQPITVPDVIFSPTIEAPIVNVEAPNLTGLATDVSVQAVVSAIAAIPAPEVNVAAPDLTSLVQTTDLPPNFGILSIEEITGKANANADVSISEGTITAMGEAIAAIVSAGGTTAYSISGTITDSNGDPIEGADVYVSASDTMVNPRQATTDGNGKYLMYLPSAGTYYVQSSDVGKLLSGIAEVVVI